MAYTIAVANEKGGVGKTTTVVNLGAAIAALGHRVLAIDLDPHCGLTISLQANGDGMHLGDWLLASDLSPLGLVQSTHIDGYDLIPADHQVASLEARLSRSPNGQTMLQARLEPARTAYDYILLDCGPSLGLLTVNALVAANGVLVPLQSDYLAMRGVGMLLDTVRAVKEQLNPSLAILGFLATMHDQRTTHAREVLGEMRRLFGPQVFEAVINYTVRLKETPLLGESIITYDPRSQAAAAYRAMAEEVVRRTGHHA
jgi:chromosome partitioning protein